MADQTKANQIRVPFLPEVEVGGGRWESNPGGCDQRSTKQPTEAAIGVGMGFMHRPSFPSLYTLDDPRALIFQI
jgi:hypothetical protein